MIEPLGADLEALACRSDPGQGSHSTQPKKQKALGGLFLQHDRSIHRSPNPGNSLSSASYFYLEARRGRAF